MLVIFLATLVGLSLGLLGGGGSILTTPILLYAAGMPGKEAIASSLVVVGVTAAVSALGYSRAGLVNWGVGLRFAAGAMLGSFAGGRLAGLFPTDLLLGVFALFMVIAGLMMLRPRPEALVAKPWPAPTLLLASTVVGVVTGLVGAGGGFVVVPMLVLAGALPMRVAVGTSLVVIALQSGAGLLGHLGHVSLNLELIALVSASAVAGSFVGGRLARWMKPASLRKNFGLFVLAMAVFMALRLVPQPLSPEVLTLLVLGTTGLGLGAGFLLGRQAQTS